MDERTERLLPQKDVMIEVRRGYSHKIERLSVEKRYEE